MTSFDQPIGVNSGHRYDIGLGLRIGTASGILAELKSYSRCSIEGKCTSKKNQDASEDDEDAEYVVKPLSQKSHKSITRQTI